MSGVARVIAVLGLVLTLAGVIAPVVSAAQAVETAFDIADVPLPVQDLPEDGYQVMAGGYLDRDAAATWIASPRSMQESAVSPELEAAGWQGTYVLDLVLLEDRGFAPSDILALVQTNVYLLPDDDGAARLFGLMADFSASQSAEEVDSPVNQGFSVSLRSQSGDTMRTVFQRERAVVEVVTLEGFGPIDPDEHRVVALATLDRLQSLQAAGDPGIAARAARLADGENLADVQNFQQSGVHHLYRIRDGVTQPAAGELDEPAPEAIASDIVQLYFGSEAMRIGRSGTGYMSTWIGEFASEASAGAFVEATTDNPSGALFDPYFRIAAGEQATSQGVAGLYRVTGVIDGQAYSGNLEVRQNGPYVIAIGFRTLGSALLPVDMTSRVMDYQLGCLQEAAACAPFDISGLLEAPSATPIPATGETVGDVIASEEFGWSVRAGGDWTINEQFAEAGYDFVELQSGRSLVTLESVINQHGDPVQCVIDELNALRELESSAVIDLGSDVPDEVPAGSEPGHAWAIYTVEPLADERADQEYTIRIDCYSLVDGGANLVVTQRAPRDEWLTERLRGNQLREGIVLPMAGVAQPIALVTGGVRWSVAA